MDVSTAFPLGKSKIKKWRKCMIPKEVFLNNDDESQADRKVGTYLLEKFFWLEREFGNHVRVMCDYCAVEQDVEGNDIEFRISSDGNDSVLWIVDWSGICLNCAGKIGFRLMYIEDPTGVFHDPDVQGECTILNDLMLRRSEVGPN
jgi:hypothetical protein